MIDSGVDFCLSSQFTSILATALSREAFADAQDFLEFEFEENIWDF